MVVRLENLVCLFYTEVGIYKRKILRYTDHAFDQEKKKENTIITKKKRSSFYFINSHLSQYKSQCQPLVCFNLLADNFWSNYLSCEAVDGVIFHNIFM